MSQRVIELEGWDEAEPIVRALSTAEKEEPAVFSDVCGAGL